jgi:hypothetical protein
MVGPQIHQAAASFTSPFQARAFACGYKRTAEGGCSTFFIVGGQKLAVTV